MSSAGTLLIVDDEFNIRLLLEEELCDAGFSVLTAESVESAKLLLENMAFDVVLTDLNMPGQTGLDLCAWVRRELPETDVILMTGYSSPESAAEGLRLGAVDYLFKPFGTLDLVVDSVQKVVERQALSLRAMKLQGRVQNLELLSSIGRLAASVSHEVNNPAEVVLGNLAVLASEVDVIQAQSPELGEKLNEFRKLVAEANSGMERMREALRNFSNLTATVGDEALLLEVQQALTTSVQAIGLEARHKTKLTTDFHPVGRVRVNSARFYQTIIHLIHDSLDRISASNTSKNEIRLSLREEEHCAVICLRDNGMRLEEEALAEVVQSILVGLSAGKGVTAVARVEDGFNRIEIRYPLERVPAPKPDSVGTAESESSSVPRALIVDDEAPIRRVMKMMLRRTHQVEEASGGMEALERLEADSDYDIILCDLMMPDVDGTRVYRRVVERWPHLGDRFLFVTGGAVTDVARSFLRENRWRVLQKPFSRGELQDAMAEVQKQ